MFVSYGWKGLLPAPCSLLPAPCSLLPAPCSLLPAPCSLKPIIVPHGYNNCYIYQHNY
ncbi:hypothetical protein [Moorena sp. SIO4G3]|uniref:hypothetical protein n=1 Tax=Moorena sp. SIO4G3 TaxID=2607821 RepID=UPI00142988E5|nr:hypothetical protein [Moorena sp. SIO4G3]NEO75029.1 hypothetical protein [Moorena sp. SIO4G3]